MVKSAVFSKVWAAISTDFRNSFLEEFHFDVVLTKICDTEKVEIEKNGDHDQGDTYLLNGSLESLLVVQNTLMNTQTIFGSIKQEAASLEVKLSMPLTVIYIILHWSTNYCIFFKFGNISPYMDVSLTNV